MMQNAVGRLHFGSMAGLYAPNERMQLTRLTEAPNRVGFGSPVRLRAVRPRFTRHAADASGWADRIYLYAISPQSGEKDDHHR